MIYSLLNPVEAERVFLGAVMLGLEETVSKALALGVEPGDFADPRHQAIFRAAQQVADGKVTVEAVLVADQMVRNGDRPDYAYLDDLIQGVSQTANVEYYARVIKKGKLAREVAEKGRRLQSLMRDGRDPWAVLEKVREWVEEVEQETPLAPTTMADTIDDTVASIRHGFEHPGERRGIRTGFHELDGILETIPPGDLTVVAGRPSMGKTSLALGALVYVAMHHGPVIAYCWEANWDRMNRRYISMRTGINLLKLKTGAGLNEHEMSQIERVDGGLPIHWVGVKDVPATVAGMRRVLDPIRRKEPVALMMIDHLQLMQSGEHGSKGQVNRAQEVAQITRGIKLLCEEYDVAALLLSQLNRNPENRGAKEHRPILADLRESGSIEQDADIVLFPYRPAYYHRDKDTPEPLRQIAEIEVAKHKDGPTGVAKVGFFKETASFHNREDLP